MERRSRRGKERGKKKRKKKVWGRGREAVRGERETNREEKGKWREEEKEREKGIQQPQIVWHYWVKRSILPQ